MELAYAAHSARCALLLDAEGICRWFLLKVDDEGVSATAKRCVGAQFVATLDPDVSGLLGPEPTVGKSILFARVDDGRVSLVRFGPLVQFDTLGPSPRARAAEEREAPQHDLVDDDQLATAAFSRAMVVRTSRRGMLPRRG